MLERLSVVAARQNSWRAFAQPMFCNRFMKAIALWWAVFGHSPLCFSRIACTSKIAACPRGRIQLSLAYAVARFLAGADLVLLSKHWMFVGELNNKNRVLVPHTSRLIWEMTFLRSVLNFIMCHPRHLSSFCLYGLCYCNKNTFTSGLQVPGYRTSAHCVRGHRRSGRVSSAWGRR